MFDHRHYVPVLRAKQGEFQALRDLDDARRARLTPFIDVGPPEQGRNVDSHITARVSDIGRAWPSSRPIFVDLTTVRDDVFVTGNDHPYARLLAEARAAGTPVVPVVSPSRGPRHVGAVRAAVREDGLGCCIRLEQADQMRYATDIDDLLRDVGASPDGCDLVIDLGSLSRSGAVAAALLGRAAMTAFAAGRAWRSVTMASGAFPQSLADVRPGKWSRVDRHDWTAWRMVATDPGVDRAPTFGDYAVTGPDRPDPAAEPWRGAPNVRYAASDAWLVRKGAGRGRNDQMYGLSAELVAEVPGRVFSGGSFSRGDAMYLDWSKRASRGPGGGREWRHAATSHHLAFVSDQIANLAGAAGGA